MTWIDTHCHIDSDKLSPNIQDVLKSGLKAGISGLVVPATSKNNFDRIIDVAHNYPQCFFALGFHPLFIDDYEEGDMDVLTAYIKKHNPIAVGEIGIDLFTRKDNLPISVIEIKKKYKKLVKIFHPDVNGNNKKAEEKFKQINESYKLLLKKFIKKNGK